MIELLPALFPGLGRGLGDLEERFSSGNSFHSDHESSWHPIKRIKSMFDSKPFPSTPIHLPFDFEFSCQDLNNLQHTDWHGSLQLKDKWEGRGEITSSSWQQACFKWNHCIGLLLQQHSCKLLCIQTGEAQLVHYSIDASQAISRCATNQWVAVVVMALFRSCLLA